MAEIYFSCLNRKWRVVWMLFHVNANAFFFSFLFFTCRMSRLFLWFVGVIIWVKKCCRVFKSQGVIVINLIYQEGLYPIRGKQSLSVQPLCIATHTRGTLNMVVFQGCQGLCVLDPVCLCVFLHVCELMFVHVFNVCVCVCESMLWKKVSLQHNQIIEDPHLKIPFLWLASHSQVQEN